MWCFLSNHTLSWMLPRAIRVPFTILTTLDGRHLILLGSCPTFCPSPNYSCWSSTLWAASSSAQWTNALDATYYTHVRSCDSGAGFGSPHPDGPAVCMQVSSRPPSCDRVEWQCKAQHCTRWSVCPAAGIVTHQSTKLQLK
jgi:hypothetical protein